MYMKNQHTNYYFLKYPNHTCTTNVISMISAKRKPQQTAGSVKITTSMISQIVGSSKLYAT